MRTTTFTLAFGMVNIPVGVAPLEASPKKATHQATADGVRPRYVVLHGNSGEEVSRKDLVTVHTLPDGRRVETTSDERKACADGRTGALTITGKIELASVDLRLLDKPMLLVPARVGKKVTAPDALALLARALDESGLALTVRYVRRDSEQNALLYSVGNALVMQDLRFGGLMRDPVALPVADVNPMALDLAFNILDSIPSSADLHARVDDYTARVAAMVEAKADGVAPAEPEAPVKVTNIVDLMEALAASLASKAA